MNHSYAVIGLGRFGLSVARTLTKNGYPVLCIDSQEELVNEIANEVEAAVCCDTTDKDALLELDIAKFSCVIVGIGSSSLQGSILTTALLSQFGCQRIVARAIHSLHGKVLKSIGATEIVNPEEEMGRRIGEKLAHPFLIEKFNLGPQLNLAEVGSPQRFVGKSLIDLDLRNAHDVSVVAIYRGKKVIASPRANEVIHENDKLVIIGDDDAIQKIAALA